MERVNQVFQDRTENFDDDYYPCIQNECNRLHIYEWKHCIYFLDIKETQKIFNIELNELNISSTYIEFIQVLSSI